MFLQYDPRIPRFDKYQPNGQIYVTKGELYIKKNIYIREKDQSGPDNGGAVHKISYSEQMVQPHNGQTDAHTNRTNRDRQAHT